MGESTQQRFLADERRERAVSLQDACNPSGVARELVRMIDAVRNEIEPAKFNTSMIGKDDGVILTVAKLADMCGIQVDWENGPVNEAYSRWFKPSEQEPDNG